MFGKSCTAHMLNLVIPLARKELAELSGMSSETVIRILKKFNDDNLITISGKGLVIVDYPRLKRISETG
jgi:CRP/FNR family transcriptional regulator, polysaccharide utilization system transcription regulator